MIICRKFDAWCRSITDEGLRKMVDQNTILTGGAIVTLLTENKVNDFDFYFRNRETAAAVAAYYVKQFKATKSPRFHNGKEVEIYVETREDERVKIIVKSAGIAGSQNESKPYEYFEQGGNASEYLNDIEGSVVSEEVKKVLDGATEPDKAEEKKEDEKERYRPIWLTSNAITLSDKIQIVVRFYGDPAQIHENYDFVHCTNYWTSWQRRVTLNQQALECIMTKELRYIGSKYPVASVFRVRKFIERGWTIGAGQLLKIVMQCAALDFNDYATLEEQLTGVDVAYFKELLDKMKEKSATAVDKTYLIQLIDRMT
jgi:hypothetical protein